MERTLYMIYGSPPVTAVLMAARALNLEIKLYEVNLMSKENLEDWFIELNPSHTVPVLKDTDGYVIWDSHAILCYLSDTYGVNSCLYPKDVKERAKVHQILNLDNGTIFRRFSDCVRPIFFDAKKTMEPKKLEALKEVYLFLERILQSTTFLVSNEVTIADISVLSTVMMSNVVLPIHEKEFPKLNKWMTHLKNMDFFKGGVKSLETFEIGYKIMTGTNK